MSPVPDRRRRPLRRFAVVLALSLAAILVSALVLLAPERAPSATGRSGDVDLHISSAAPSTWDPALQGDVATAATLAQVYEGLTAFDPNSRVQPALARSWRTEDEGRRLVFQLRPDLRFSDGRPLGPEDVVASWFRLLDPARPSPLASLLSDVRGANDYLRGRAGREVVGIRAEGDSVVVDFRRPAGHFVAAAASPSLAVIPQDAPAFSGEELPGGFVGSGAYVPVSQEDDTITLRSNPHYWAGQPALERIEMVTDLAGESPVTAFEERRLDYVDVGSLDASWIRYDRSLGPHLRRTERFAIDYYGFDTTRPPFDDPRVRRAFAQAVDWDRLVLLSGSGAVPADSLVPPGVAARSQGAPGGGSAVDFSPRHDPGAARASLAAAGYPGGAGFPRVTLVTSGSAYDRPTVHELKEVLGVTVALETMPFDEYFDRLEEDPPAFWSLSWIADYPHAHDFLGLLLESGSTNNYGGWSHEGYDTALEAAGTTADPAEQARRYEDAERIVLEQAPVVPVSYGESWALSREGLEGAVESGMGFIRFAGLRWRDG